MSTTKEFISAVQKETEARLDKLNQELEKNAAERELLLADRKVLTNLHGAFTPVNTKPGPEPAPTKSPGGMSYTESMNYDTTPGPGLL